MTDQTEHTDTDRNRDILRLTQSNAMHEAIRRAAEAYGAAVAARTAIQVAEVALHGGDATVDDADHAAARAEDACRNLLAAVSRIYG
jgi:hypothetical protein